MTVHRLFLLAIVGVLALTVGCTPARQQSWPTRLAEPKSLIGLKSVSHDLVHSSQVGELDEAIASFERDVLQYDAAALTAEFAGFSEYYRGDLALTDTDRRAYADMLAISAGKQGRVNLLEGVLAEASPAVVWYAIAEARGIRLYYSITEGACLDRIIDLEHVKVLARENRWIGRQPPPMKPTCRLPPARCAEQPRRLTTAPTEFALDA